MSSRVTKLAAAYRQHLSVPWQAGLAAIQRVIFAVYDKADELRLRANVGEFELATQQASKQWLLLDVTNAFPMWMAAQEYRDAYFESPEDLAGYQTGELTEFVADLTAKLKARIAAEAGPDTVVALQGVGALFGLARVASDTARKLGDKTFIVPLRLEQYDAPFLVAQTQYINFKGSWAKGLAELSELLRDMQIPRGTPGAMEAWLDAQSAGADKLLERSEPLVSNWLQVARQPETIHFCESPVGAPLEPFLNRLNHKFPSVPHRAGVITFAMPDEDGMLGAALPGKHVASMPAQEFLHAGWPQLGIDSYQAKRIYSDLGSQAFDGFCQGRGLRGVVGSGKRVSWWADLKTAPAGQVRFDWGFRRGSRQVVGQSGKRGVHWHYALNAQLRASPLWHLRLSPRLVFSTNGMDAIDDVKRSHALRRSFAKGWRNARWRDMLCAQLWWLAEGRSEIRLPVASDEVITLIIPPMQFSCPVTVLEGTELPADEDDPDIPSDTWSDEQSEEADA